MKEKDKEIDGELINITKTFGDVLALDNISLSIEKGEFLSLIGPSGCGKTTLLRIISGLEKADEGIVKIQGKVVNNLPPDKRVTAMVFQRWALFPHKSVFDNIAFGLKMRRTPRPVIEERVKRILKLTSLSNLEDRMPNQLSGGQQQRVALARALVVEPPILLLDEPLGSLDLKLRKQMELELKKIHRELGITFIFVTHDQEEAMIMSDRIAVMNQGRIEQIGTPMEIYQRAKTRFTAEFIGETNLIKGEVLSVTPSEGVAKIYDHTMVILNERNLTQGEKVYINIKPIDIEMDQQLQGFKNIFRGRIKEKVYIGSVTKYYVDLGKGFEVLAEISGKKRKREFDLNGWVDVGWESEDCHVIKG